MSKFSNDTSEMLDLFHIIISCFHRELTMCSKDIALNLGDFPEQKIWTESDTRGLTIQHVASIKITFHFLYPTVLTVDVCFDYEINFNLLLVNTFHCICAIDLFCLHSSLEPDTTDILIDCNVCLMFLVQRPCLLSSFRF